MSIVRSRYYQRAIAALAFANLIACGGPPDRINEGGEAKSSGSTFEVTVSEVPNVIFFGAGSDAASWLGRPVFVDSSTGRVELLSFSEGTAWGTLCQSDIGTKVSGLVQKSWNARKLRDSVRSPENKSFWEKVRANWVLVTGATASKDKFVALFAQSEQAKAEMVWDWVSDPSVEQDMDPRAVLGLSQKALGAQAGVAVSDRFSAGFKASHMNLNFYVASIWGQFAVSTAFTDCLKKAIDTTGAKKPTHLVSSLSLGALFTFSAGATEVSAEGGAAAGMVEVKAKMDFSKVRLSAAIHGTIDSKKYQSIEEVLKRNQGTVADDELLKYMEAFANSIDTPVFVAGNLMELSK